jgi:NAD(P)-dependent dehydrogenase (short-subunit alcohol dehydrogenase family)
MSVMIGMQACIKSVRRIIDAATVYGIRTGLPMKLDDKIALVTGSARGLGWEIIQAFTQEGAKVAICDLSQADVDEAAARLGLPDEKILGVKADVTVERDVVNLFEMIKKKFGRIDVVVNNAGFAWPRGGPVNLELADTPLDVWLKVLDTNLNGTFLCSREALKIMRPQGSGSIVNISSPQGKKGKLLRGPYCAAKFGVEGLTQVLALENKAYNIKVNCLDPGGIVATEAIRKIPGNRGVRMLSPEIIRACAVYLASDESNGVTSHSLVATDWNKEHGFEVPYTVA